MTNKHAVLIYHSNIIEQYTDLDSLQPSLQSILQQSYSNYDILELNYGNDTTHIFPNSTLFWNIKFDTSKKAQSYSKNHMRSERCYEPNRCVEQICLITLLDMGA